MPKNSIAGDASLPGLQTTAFSPCPHMAFSLCGDREGGRERGERARPLVSLPLLIGTPTLLREGPPLVTSSNLNYLHKGRPWLQIQSHWGSGLQHMNFRGHNSVHSMHQTCKVAMRLVE